MVATSHRGVPALLTRLSAAGAESGGTWVYEDDGATLNYISGAFANTTCVYSFSSNTEATVKIATEGAFPELPTTRTYTVVFVNAPPASAVTANGATLQYDRWGGPNTWTYDGECRLCWPWRWAKLPSKGWPAH